MFSGNRRFNGRQGEQIYNEELYKLYEILKHFLDTPANSNPKIGPQSGLEQPGALWLDRQNSPGYAHLMYRDSDKEWKPIFDDWFKIIKEIRNPNGKPENPREGQLWIDDNGILHWYNGSVFVPIKSTSADTVDFDTNAFANFLIIDPLKMTGGYIIENLSKLTQISQGITQWRANTLYQKDQIVYYTDVDGETKFYKFLSGPYTSAATIKEDIAAGRLKEVDLKAQYLIPSETLDKVFMNGLYTNSKSYDRLSDVCIQISLSVYQGKTIAAVHVNPIALKNIHKRIIRIEKDKTQLTDYMMVKVGPENTEYYGFVNGFGQLLSKGEDYITKANGIQLVGDAATHYDFVYCLTYEFETRIKNEGKLYKNTITLSNQTSIWIGQIDKADKLLIFAHGLCLEDFYYSYNAEDPSGLVKFNGFTEQGKITDDPTKMVKPLFESKTDITIMRFGKKTNAGVFTPDMLENAVVDAGETQSGGTYIENGKTKYIAKVPIPGGYTRPLIFVQGPYLNMILGDYTITNNEAIIKDAQPGTAYYIVDAARNDGFDMYVGAGTVGADNSIPITDTQIISGECQPLIFVDGFYISSRDYDMSDPKKIKIYGLTQGQEYVILKDKNDDKYQLLFDGEVAFTTIPVDGDIDDAVIYIGSNAIVDGGACVINNTSTDNAMPNEIKFIVADGKQDWYYYQAGNNKWIKIDDKNQITMLDSSTSGYTINTRTINILQNYGAVDCTYYAYAFADHIEKPLIKGYTSDCSVIGDELFYKIDTRYSYPIGENALHVWMNGVKQEIKEHYITETATNTTETIVGHAEDLPGDNKIHTEVEWTQTIKNAVNEVTMNMYVSTTKAINQQMNCVIRIDGVDIAQGNITVNHTGAGRTKVLTASKSYPVTAHTNITISGAIPNLTVTNTSGTKTVNPVASSTVNLIGSGSSKGRVVQGFLVPKPTDANGVELQERFTCFYVIERPESGEHKACVVEKLGTPVGINTYVTNTAILAPGVPRIFIDGYRQPQGSYIINNMNTITLIEPVLTDVNNTVIITDDKGNNIPVQMESRASVVVEVRQDYTLKERTVELTAESLQTIIQGGTAVFDINTTFANKQKLPIDLFNSKVSEINIFINGAAYGMDFSNIKNQNIITLSNIEIVKTLSIGDKITFEWR